MGLLTLHFGTSDSLQQLSETAKWQVWGHLADSRGPAALNCCQSWSASDWRSFKWAHAVFMGRASMTRQQSSARARYLEREQTILLVDKRGVVAGTDLGFGKSGCPVHQKGAPRRNARWRCALPGVSRANPENWKFRTLRCIFPAFWGTTTYMIECAFMVFCRQYYIFI